MNLLTKITGSLVLATALLGAAEYKVDNAHSNVGFTVKHMMITNVHGNFKTYDAMIDFDEKNRTFKNLKATIDTTSIYTGIEKEMII